ncbi:MAG: hypothetical protein WAM28_01260, partial [Chlamydiales bacterium]
CGAAQVAGSEESGIPRLLGEGGSNKEYSMSSQTVPSIDRENLRERQENPSKREGAIAGRRVQVLETNWHNAVQPVFSNVAVFATEIDCVRMRAVSKEVKEIADKAKKVRWKEVYGLDETFYTDSNYNKVVKHRIGILNKMPYDVFFSLEAPRFAETFARINSEEGARILVTAYQYATFGFRGYKKDVENFIKMAEELARVGLIREAAESLVEARKVAIKYIEKNCLDDFLKAIDAFERTEKPFSKSMKTLINNEIRILIDAFVDAQERIDPNKKNIKRKLLTRLSKSFTTSSYIKFIVKRLKKAPDVDAQERIDPNKKIAEPIRNAQKSLPLIKRQLTFRLPESHFSIVFFLKRWIEAPEEAVADKEKMRELIKETEDSTKKIMIELYMIIASVLANIDPADDLKEAHKIAMKIEKPSDRIEILIIIAFAGYIKNSEEVVQPLKTVCEDVSNYSVQAYQYFSMLTSIDLERAPNILVEEILSGVQNLSDKALLLTWIGRAQTAINPQKAKEIFSHVLEIIDNLEGLDKERVCGILALEMSELDPQRAYEIVRKVSIYPLTLIKIQARIKIAQVMMNRAMTKKDLDEAAKVFQEAQDLAIRRFPSSYNLLLDLFDSSIPVFDEIPHAQMPMTKV